MIRFNCFRCNKSIKAPDENAGRMGKCPRCGQRLRVPDAEPPPVIAPQLAEPSVVEAQAAELPVDGAMPAGLWILRVARVMRSLGRLGVFFWVPTIVIFWFLDVPGFSRLIAAVEVGVPSAVLIVLAHLLMPERNAEEIVAVKAIMNTASGRWRMHALLLIDRHRRLDEDELARLEKLREQGVSVKDAAEALLGRELSSEELEWAQRTWETSLTKWGQRHS